MADKALREDTKSDGSRQSRNERLRTIGRSKYVAYSFGATLMNRGAVETGGASKSYR
jgi:hypothetical protein